MTSIPAALFHSARALLRTATPLLGLVAALLVEVQAAAADSVTNYAGTATDLANNAKAWTNPSNATGSSTATYALSASLKNTSFPSVPVLSNTLNLTNYGFSIPTGSTINGITVSLYRSDTSTGTFSGSVADNTIRLLVGGVASGDNKADAATIWPPPASAAAATYGSSTDLWGLTPTVAQINGSNFGVTIVIESRDSFNSETGRVYYAAITVDYTPPTPTPTNTPTYTNTPTITPTNTKTPTVTPTNTSTSSPTITPTNTNTPTSAPTNTNTPTNTPTNTNTPTPTPTNTNTPTNTPTNTATPTVTPTNTSTPTTTPTATPTNTSTPTRTPTATPTVPGTVTPQSSASSTCEAIKIMNPSLGSQSGGSRPVTFDLSWCWSWRSSTAVNNWDAAWVFVKYRKNGGDWAHATLNDTGHVMGTGTAATYDLGLVDPTAAYDLSTNPAVGVFIYRSGVGAGTFSQTGTSLSWNYSQDGVADNDTVEIQVFGIEMVLVPQGTFFAGDRDTSTGSFKQGSSDTDPWYVGSEGAISVTNTSGNGSNAGTTLGSYYYQTDSSSDDDATGAAFTIPAGYPKGYDAFYIMKGEISQGQWVAFFNTLTATQKSTRDLTGASGKNTDSLTYRNNVSWTGSGNATLPNQGGGANYEATAMSYLRWSDLAAYLDWSGLRPMSELEFERAARGPYQALAGEYAWGSTSITQATSVTNAGGLTEAAELGANCSYGSHASVQGPLRVGSFSYEKASRVPSGGGYYGAMDMSGNLTERTVTVGNSAGRAFEGTYHGNGVLDSSGDADVSTWPGTSASGAGFRGGSWSKASTYARLSDRTDAAKITATSANDSGGRGVRSAPAGLMPTPTPTP